MPFTSDKRTCTQNNPKTILRSSSNSSKFEDDEFTGFAENNTKIPNAEEERAVSKWYGKVQLALSI